MLKLHEHDENGLLCCADICNAVRMVSKAILKKTVLTPIIKLFTVSEESLYNHRWNKSVLLEREVMRLTEKNELSCLQFT